MEEWKAFYNLEPFGAEADDYRAGITPAVLANINKKKGARSFSSKDFMADRVKPYRKPKKQHFSLIKDMLMSMVKKGKK